MKLHFRILALVATLSSAAGTVCASAATTAPVTFSFEDLRPGAASIPFSLPKFDRALGSLQSVDISWEFSGTVLGSASGISNPTAPTITHAVYFDLEDLSDSIFIADPKLALTAPVTGTSMTFGPEFQATSLSYSLSPGDPRFEAWKNGPGASSASLRVYFKNTTMSDLGIKFFDGTDTGVYSGSFSVAYTYVPEPSGLSLLLVGVPLLAWRPLRRPAAPDHRPSAARTFLG